MTGSLRTDYDRIAGLYDVDRASWVIGPDKVVAALLADARTNLRVVDIGCGTGLYLCAQREHFGQSPVAWFGVDASTQMLSNAIAKKPGLRVAQARAESLPVGGETIDYAYSSFAFHHFTDKPAALDEVARILRTNGRLRIRNMDPWGQRQWWIYEYFDGAWENDVKRFWPADRIQSELDQRGFVVDTDIERSERERTVSEVLDEAERRVISQLSILDDGAYDAGLARLRALPADQPIDPERSGLTLTARKR